jgi:hypothetical protein
VSIFALGHDKGTLITADTLEEAVQLNREFSQHAHGTGISLLL